MQGLLELDSKFSFFPKPRKPPLTNSILQNDCSIYIIVLNSNSFYAYTIMY
jgi:hypothetical protein